MSRGRRCLCLPGSTGSPARPPRITPASRRIRGAIHLTVGLDAGGQEEGAHPRPLVGRYIATVDHKGVISTGHAVLERPTSMSATIPSRRSTTFRPDRADPSLDGGERYERVPASSRGRGHDWGRRMNGSSFTFQRRNCVLNSHQRDDLQSDQPQLCGRRRACPRRGAEGSPVAAAWLPSCASWRILAGGDPRARGS
jgi:hypothetical protein